MWLRVVGFRSVGARGRGNSGSDVEIYSADGDCGRSTGIPSRGPGRTILLGRVRRLWGDRGGCNRRRHGADHGR